MSGGAPGAAFATAMARLGPFEPAPLLAVAVSGGGDSMALALLADDWARARGGAVLALAVDHGLRPESGAEAEEALARLGARGIAGRKLALSGLARGPSLAERARAARYAVLTASCAEAGILHLLLGHQMADQAETVLMRELAGSGEDGLAGMAALVETPTLRLLRPLLDIPPAALRGMLISAGIGWVEDPSNRDQRALRPRLRALRRDRDGTGAATRALAAAARSFGAARAGREQARAGVLAERVRFHPEGFALLAPGKLAAEALAAVLRMVAGAAHGPAPAQVAALAADLRPATLGGVRLMQAGRLGPGLLAVREAAAMAPPVPARAGAIWDGRFRLMDAPPQDGAQEARLGALGEDAARLRDEAAWPAAVLRTLPVVRRGNTLVAVPHLCYPDLLTCADWPLAADPSYAAAPAPFVAG